MSPSVTVYDGRNEPLTILKYYVLDLCRLAIRWYVIW
jgi:hypothetical protein